MQSFCGCEIEASDEPMLMQAVKATPRQFKFQSGAKFVESSSKPHVRFYFMKAVPYNAISTYMGDGKIYLSQTRPVTAPVVHACVQHEVGHYFGIKANPPADKWGHCRVASCIMNINGNGTAYCAGCRSQLVAKYGRA